MTKIILTLLVIGAVLLWLHMQSIKQLALAAAKRYCRDNEVQLLDGTVVLKAVKLARNRSGSPGLKQRFEFEFTVTGERRYRGEVVFIGKRMVYKHLEPHRFDSANTEPPNIPPPYH